MDKTRRQIQIERRKRAQKRDRLVLVSLLGVLAVVILTFSLLSGQAFQLPKIQWSFPTFLAPKKTTSKAKVKKELLKGAFEVGQQVMLADTAFETAQEESLEPYQNRLALVTKLSKTGSDAKIVYQLQFSPSEKVSQVYEEDLSAIETTFSLDQDVELLDRDGGAKVTQIRKEDFGYLYTIEMDSGEVVDQLTETQLAFIEDVPVKEGNTAKQNNQILQEAINQSEQYAFTILRFPKGRYKIGSQNPNEEYVLLKSNTELRGQDTTLVVEGSARWYGLATGQTAYDGLSYFLMNGLHIEASDLEKGNQFIIMANHGHSWYIKNNRFTMVHQMSSHIFDLGGVQNASFEDNVFEGYAPELTTVTELGNQDLHHFYSEAIQLDESSLQTGWDGGMMKAIDPNYQWTSVNTIQSNNITITRNQFLPYYKDGHLVAYGATVGQHSSLVGAVAIFENTFKNTLTKRFQDANNPNWVLEPVHLNTTVPGYIENNTVE